MQENYTSQARNALAMAEKTAKRCQHSYRNGTSSSGTPDGTGRDSGNPSC